MRKYLFIAVLATAPCLSWYLTPLMAMNIPHSCQAKTLQIYDDGKIKVVSHAHWNMQSSEGKGVGFYSGELQTFHPQQQTQDKWNIDLALTTTYAFEDSHIEAKTTNVSRLAGQPEALHLLNQYIYPALMPGYLSIATVYRGPGGVMISGLSNENPRVMCFN